jgi:predicted phage terminase large subunit-like protein
MKAEAGPLVWVAQYEQRPQVQGGGTFKRDWFRFWHYIPGIPEPCLCDVCFNQERDQEGHQGVRTCSAIPETGLEAQTWDLAFKDLKSSDFVAGQVWRIAAACYWLIDRRNERLSYPESRTAIRDMTRKWPRAYDKLVEDKANGPAVMADLKGEIHGLTPVSPQGGKEARANAASPSFADGRVFVPHPSLAPWVWPYLKQFEAFPKGANDDEVDATTQFLVYAKKGQASFSEAMRKIRGES